MTSNRSASERVQEALEKINQIDRSGYKLNSVIATSSTALDEARKYDQDAQDLPLGGQPILIKDNIEVRGLPASAGSLALTGDRKSTRLNSSHVSESRMPSSA